MAFGVAQLQAACCGLTPRVRHGVLHDHMSSCMQCASVRLYGYAVAAVAERPGCGKLFVSVTGIWQQLSVSVAFRFRCGKAQTLRSSKRMPKDLLRSQLDLCGSAVRTFKPSRKKEGGCQCLLHDVSLCMHTYMKQLYMAVTGYATGSSEAAWVIRTSAPQGPNSRQAGGEVLF